MKLLYSENKCIGCGACEIASPILWTMSTKTGKAELIGAFFKKGNYYLDIFPDDLEMAEKSKKSCPTKAITIQ